MQIVKVCYRCAEDLKEGYELTALAYPDENSKCDFCRSKTLLTVYEATPRKHIPADCPQDCAECPY